MAVRKSLCYVIFFAIATIAVIKSAGAEVGIYNAELAGGRSAGVHAIKNTIASEDIGVEEFSRLSIENLLKYRVVIIPNTRELARGEDPRWTDNLRAYVAEAGGALVFCHDAVGAERSPFGRIPLFPEIVMTGTVERSENQKVEVALPADSLIWDFEYLQEYTGGETAEHMYFDRFMFAQSGGTHILSDPESRRTVVGTGEVGRGRVVFNGTFGAHPVTHTAMELEGIDRDVMVNTVRWALAGGGPFVESPGDMEVARWISEIEKPESKGSIALVFGDGGAGAVSQHVAEENVKRAGIPYDLISLSSIGGRGLEKDTHPVSFIFLEPDTGQVEIETIKSYLASGGKAVVFLPQYFRGEGVPQLLEAFSCRDAEGYRNTHRPEIWGRFRKITFTDPGNMPEKIENIPRLLRNISLVSDDAEVIAYWEDLGREVAIPAVIRHEYGYIFNNNSFGDLHNLRIFLANAVIELNPRAGEGVYNDLLELYRDRKAEIDSKVRGALGEAYLEKAQDFEMDASRARKTGDYKEAISFLIEADKKLIYAYAASMESVQDEVRMVFAVNLTDPVDAVSRLSKSGANVLALHRPPPGLYPSELFDVEVKEDFFGNLVDVALRGGLRMSASFDTFRLHQGSEVYEKARTENWEVVPPADYGKPKRPLPERSHLDNICIAHPEVVNHAIARAVEVARNYPVDYIFFDHIRWPNSPYTFCVCDFCRTQFQEDAGIRVENWPDDVLRGRNQQQFNDWRASHVTRVVRETSRILKEINPDIKLGIYARPRRAAERGGQYWWEWGDYLDYIMPMYYSPDIDRLRDMLVEANSLLDEGKRAKLVPCLGVAGYRIGDPLIWLKQIELQRELAPAGMMFFHYAFFSEPNIELLSIGPYREKTK